MSSVMKADGKGRRVEKAAVRPLPLRPDILAIGSSTGGPQALIQVLTHLKHQPHLPVFITQHMPAAFTKVLAEQITRQTAWPCRQAENGDEVKGGNCYLAPGDYHMVLRQGAAGLRLRLEQTPPENFCRPAVDPMLRSLSTVYGRRLLVVILTGMGHDGLEGCKAVTKAGGHVLAQDEATSAVWGMPGAVAKGGLTHAVLPLGDIAPYINDTFLRGGGL
jgi:two-component system, chemotaxis family, protein-glutamate methylesterase/glutaminase